MKISKICQSSFSSFVTRNGPEDKILITAGGFSVIEYAKSNTEIDLTPLKANHEETDTCIVLHCIHTEAYTIVVSCLDTDVLLLLLADFEFINCIYLWMKAGTLKNPKYTPVHDIH